MERKNSLKKRILAIVLTLFFGAGVGHLYLKKFLKAAVLIGINLILAGILILQIGRENFTKGESPLSVLNDFMVANKKQLIYHDILVAAVLAYALVDIWKITETRDDE